MKKIFQILIILTGGLLLNSCYYDADPVFDDIGGGDTPSEEVKYGEQIQPIWNAKCTSCHNASHALDLREGTSYNELVPNYVIEGDAFNSPLYLKLEAGHGNSSITDKTLIRSWINQGAKDN